MTACAASPTAAMSSSEMSIADPGKEIRYFVIVRSSGCEFPDEVLFLDFRPFNHQRHYLPGRIGNRRTAAPAVISVSLMTARQGELVPSRFPHPCQRTAG